MGHQRVRSAVVVSALLAGSCRTDVIRPADCVPPEPGRFTVSANPANVLSAIAVGPRSEADSVTIQYGPLGEALDSMTPAVTANDMSAFTVPVLGLLPSTTYAMRLVAYGECGAVTGPEVLFSTGALPADLPAYSASGTNPSPGYVVFAAGMYGIAIDNSGRVVWYHRFPNGPGLNFQAQPNGRFVARPNVPADSVGVWLEVDALGNSTRTLRCARGLSARPHDLIALPDGSVWLMCDEIRRVDLSAVGRATDTNVMGTAVQHLAADGRVLFEWSPFDHLAVELATLDPTDTGGSTINWTHGNSIALDAQGDLYVSFRNLNEIVKVDTRTGHVAWRFGGARSQLALTDPSAAPFARQHGLRVVERELLLLDNLGDAATSRAKRFKIGDGGRSASLTRVLTPRTPVVARLGGSVEALANGGTLVSFGNGGRVEEYDAAANVTWQLDGNPGYVFRAQRIASLYGKPLTSEVR